MRVLYFLVARLITISLRIRQKKKSFVFRTRSVENESSAVRLNE